MLNYVNDGSSVKLPQPGAISDDEYAQMATTLITLAKRIRALFGLALADAGLHNGQDQLLSCLVPDKPCAVAELAYMLDVRPSTISKMLDRFSDRGLVARRQAPLDRRITLVCITEQGVEAQEKVWRLWAEVCRQVAPGLPGEPATILRQLGDVSDALGARLMRLR